MTTETLMFIFRTIHTNLVEATNAYDFELAETLMSSLKELRSEIDSRIRDLQIGEYVRLNDERVIKVEGINCPNNLIISGDVCYPFSSVVGVVLA